MPTKSHGLDDCVVIFILYLTDVIPHNNTAQYSTTAQMVDKHLSNTSGHVTRCRLSLSNTCVDSDVEREDISRPELHLEHLYNDEHFHLPC